MSCLSGDAVSGEDAHTDPPATPSSRCPEGDFKGTKEGGASRPNLQRRARYNLATAGISKTIRSLGGVWLDPHIATEKEDLKYLLLLHYLVLNTNLLKYIFQICVARKIKILGKAKHLI